MRKRGLTTVRILLAIIMFCIISFMQCANNYAYANMDEVVPDLMYEEELDENSTSSIAWDSEDDLNREYKALEQKETVYTNLAFKKKATCSSVEKGTNFVAKNAIDDNDDTRWASEEKKDNPEWLQIDLGGNMIINKVDIKWESAYAKEFKIEVSKDGNTYSTVATVKDNKKTFTSNTFESVETRYVRIYCTKKATKYGYSIYEVGVYNIRPTMSNINLALNKTVTCSSVEEGTNFVAKNVVDGTNKTRWASVEKKSNAEWIQIDLGSIMTINEVDINWEAAYAKEFKVEVSTDGNKYKTVATIKNNTLLNTEVKFDVTDARYVRVYCTKKATKYGYSIYEVSVFNKIYLKDQDKFKEDEEKFLKLVNEARVNAGLSELRVNSALRECAIVKAYDLVNNNYFAHESPVYGSPFDMMEQFNISYRSAGENLAGNKTVERAFNALMNSEGHRANILNKKYTYVGFGIADSPRYGKIFVQHFIGV